MKIPRDLSGHGLAETLSPLMVVARNRVAEARKSAILPRPNHSGKCARESATRLATAKLSGMEYHAKGSVLAVLTTPSSSLSAFTENDGGPKELSMLKLSPGRSCRTGFVLLVLGMTALAQQNHKQWADYGGGPDSFLTGA